MLAFPLPPQQPLKQTVKTGTTNKVIDEMVEESNKRIDETKDSDMTNIEKVITGASAKIYYELLNLNGLSAYHIFSKCSRLIIKLFWNFHFY